MIVIRLRGIRMPVVVVERAHRGPVGLHAAVQHEAVEGHANRPGGPNRRREEEWRRVVVVVVGATGVTTEVVEFSEEERVIAAVVEGVEDRNAVGGQSYSPAVQVGLARDRLVGQFGHQIAQLGDEIGGRIDGDEQQAAPAGHVQGGDGIGVGRVHGAKRGRAHFIVSMRLTISLAKSTKACAPLEAGSNTTPGRP